MLVRVLFCAEALLCQRDADVYLCFAVLGFWLQDRATRFAVGNGVLLGSLLELLVVRGGPEGMLQAVSVVDGCHTQGVFWGIQGWGFGVHRTTQVLVDTTGGLSSHPCAERVAGIVAAWRDLGGHASTLSWRPI